MGGGATRKHGEQQQQLTHPVSNSSLQANTKGCQPNKKVQGDNKCDSNKSNIVEYDAAKENMNAESNSIPQKEKDANEEHCNKITSSNDNCRLTNSTTDKQIRRHVYYIKLSVNNTNNASSNKVFKPVCNDKNLKSNHQARRENPIDLVHPKTNKKPISQCHQDEKERSIRFAKLFCSRSIKSSSKAKDLKRFENAIENNMHSVLPLLKDDQGLRCGVERKRKRSINNDKEFPSTLNSIALGNDRKRLKYDVRNRHLNQE